MFVGHILLGLLMPSSFRLYPGHMYQLFCFENPLENVDLLLLLLLLLYEAIDQSRFSCKFFLDF